MAFDLLPSLKVGNMRAVICVHVSRKWEYRGGTDNGNIQHVDLVLVDEKGNSMYGEIPAAEVQLKSPLLQENGIYVISRFRVSNAKRSFRPVASQFMVEFTFRTQVSAAREEIPGFPLYAYRLTPIDDLKARAGDTTDFVDVIGLLSEVSEPYMVQLPNKNEPALTTNIVLRDRNYSEIKVTLWGERANTFVVDQALTATKGKPVVVLLVGTLMKRYQDNYYLSANAAARWYFNPQIPEARHLYGGLQDQCVDVRHVAAPRQAENQRCPPAQLVAKTLLELNEMDPYDYEEHGYRCTITVGRLVPNVSWWFESCTRCSKSCSPHGNGYRCNACSSTSFRFKYKISFVALDGTEEGEMICFGDVARQIVGKPVQQLLRSATAASQVPSEITRMVTRRFTFAVTLTQQSYYRANKTYQVNSVIEAHGQNEAAPAAPPPPALGSPSTPTVSSAMASAESALSAGTSTPLSSSAPNGTDMTVLNDQTPNTELSGEGTTPVKSREKSGKGGHPSARKRLVYESSDEEVPHGSPGNKDAETTPVSLEPSKSGEILADGVQMDNVAGDKKRPRSARVAGQRAT